MAESKLEKLLLCQWICAFVYLDKCGVHVTCWLQISSGHSDRSSEIYLCIFYYNYSIIFQHTTIIRLTMQDINAWHHGHFRKTDNSIFITLERTSLPFLSSVTWCDHMGMYILRHSYAIWALTHVLLPGSPHACRRMFMRARNVHRLVYACLHKRNDIGSANYRVLFLYPQI